MSLETQRSTLRQRTDDFRDYAGRSLTQQLSAVEGEIAEEESRLRLLLSEPRGKTPEGV